MIEKAYYVYLLTNWNNKVMYVGMTNDLQRRVYEHKEKGVKGFTEKYSLDKLVWYERHETMESAIQREKSMKFWKRHWKLKTIEEMNPDWRDLSEKLV